MTHKPFLLGTIFLLACKVASSQYDFDSVKICHKNEELKDISIGEYQVKLTGGQLSFLSSKDDAVKYEAGKKLFIIKNLVTGASISFQLVNKGVVISTKDTSFVLSLPKSIKIADSVDGNDVEALYAIGGFSFALKFKKDRIDRISVPTTGKYIAISLVQVQSVDTWDFLIESPNHLNKVLLAYSFNNPYSLTIHNDKDGIGIRLLAKKKNGVFTLL